MQERPAVWLVFSAIQKAVQKANHIGTHGDFTVMIPKAVVGIGILDALVSLIFIGCIFFSNMRSYIILYLLFGLFLWLGMYLVLKTITFKVIVKGETITVHPMFAKAYTFPFDDIVSAVRQVKKRYQGHAERIIVRTNAGKKVIVESSEIAYKRFAKRLVEKVDHTRLLGFETMK